MSTAGPVARLRRPAGSPHACPGCRGPGFGLCNQRRRVVTRRAVSPTPDRLCGARPGTNSPPRPTCRLERAHTAVSGDFGCAGGSLRAACRFRLVCSRCAGSLRSAQSGRMLGDGTGPALMAAYHGGRRFGSPGPLRGPESRLQSKLGNDCGALGPAGHVSAPHVSPCGLAGPHIPSAPCAPFNLVL